MKKRRSLSVASELEELTCAVDAARLIAEYLDMEQLATMQDAERAPKMIAAVLNMVGARLTLLCRVARGSIDPAILISQHNEALTGEGGLVVPAWINQKTTGRESG